MILCLLSDPLHYIPLLYNVPLSASEWLHKTFEFEYPYAPVRIFNMMHTKYATPGDLVVTSMRGYDFGVNCEPFTGCLKAGHGGKVMFDWKF